MICCPYRPGGLYRHERQNERITEYVGTCTQSVLLCDGHKESGTWIRILVPQSVLHDRIIEWSTSALLLRHWYAQRALQGGYESHQERRTKVRYSTGPISRYLPITYLRIPAPQRT
jgi:hypothetical protein